MRLNTSKVRSRRSSFANRRAEDKFIVQARALLIIVEDYSKSRAARLKSRTTGQSRNKSNKIYATNLPADLKLGEFAAPRQPRLRPRVRDLGGRGLPVRTVHQDVAGRGRRCQAGVGPVELAAHHESGLHSSMQIQREHRHFYVCRCDAAATP
jgi:hypothetical protein